MKFQKFITSIFFAFVAVVILGNQQFSSAQRATRNNLTVAAEDISGDRFTVVTKTPKGAKIYAVRKPNAAMLRTIDKGLSDLFAVSIKNGYDARLNYSDYTIYIARADRTKDSAGNYSPDIAIGAAQYAGTDYDQGGFIYVAGMIISNQPCAFLIAEHDRNLQRVSEIVRYEGEHLVLFHNDRQFYEETKDHSRGGGHPILK